MGSCCCSMGGGGDLGDSGGVDGGVGSSVVSDRGCDIGSGGGDIVGAGGVALGLGGGGVGRVDGVRGGGDGVARSVVGGAASTSSMELLTMVKMSRVGGDATAAVTTGCLSLTSSVNGSSSPAAKVLTWLTCC